MAGWVRSSSWMAPLQTQRPRLVGRWITHATLRSPLVLCQVRRNGSPALPLTGTS
jgi:hypothetical protein